MRQQINIKLLIVTLLAGLSAAKVSANGFGLPDQDAFATARGEAFAATADNASAIYYNPAGITQLTNSNVRGGLYTIYLDPTFRPSGAAPNAGHTYHSADKIDVIPQLFYTYAAKGVPLSFGLGIYAPFGGKTKWPETTGFRSVAISGSLQYITINPVVAVKLAPGLSVGAGVMVNYADMSLHQGLRAFAPRGTNFFNFSGDGWGVGGNAGILWQPVEQLSFGANFRSSSQMKFRGSTDFELQPGVYNTPAKRNASMSLNFPMTAVLGVSYRPTPKWNLEFDANYTDWSSFGTATIKQSPPAVRRPFDQIVPVNLGWQPSWMYEFGVTRYFDNGWHVSGGYAFNGNSVPNKFYTPLAADLNRNFFSFGIGRSGKTFDFDLTYQLGYSPQHTVTGSTASSKPGGLSGENADGTYGFTSSALFLTVGMHF